MADNIFADDKGDFEIPPDGKYRLKVVEPGEVKYGTKDQRVYVEVKCKYMEPEQNSHVWLKLSPYWFTYVLVGFMTATGLARNGKVKKELRDNPDKHASLNEAALADNVVDREFICEMKTEKGKGEYKDKHMPVKDTFEAPADFEQPVVLAPEMQLEEDKDDF